MPWLRGSLVPRPPCPMGEKVVWPNAAKFLGGLPGPDMSHILECQNTNQISSRPI